MRFMMIVRSTPETEAGAMPEPGLLAAMAGYHEELAQAGVLLDATGLHPSARGWRIHYHGGRRRVVDGPFAETQELIAGYTLIQVRDRAEAMEWARRFPAPLGEAGDAVLEVRQLFEPEVIEPGPAAERLRAMGASR